MPRLCCHVLPCLLCPLRRVVFRPTRGNVSPFPKFCSSRAQGYASPPGTYGSNHGGYVSNYQGSPSSYGHGTVPSYLVHNGLHECIVLVFLLHSQKLRAIGLLCVLAKQAPGYDYGPRSSVMVGGPIMTSPGHVVSRSVGYMSPPPVDYGYQQHQHVHSLGMHEVDEVLYLWTECQQWTIFENAALQKRPGANTCTQKYLIASMYTCTWKHTQKNTTCKNTRMLTHIRVHSHTHTPLDVVCKLTLWRQVRTVTREVPMRYDYESQFVHPQVLDRVESPEPVDISVCM